MIIYVNYYEDEKKAWINHEGTTGVEYDCKDKEELKEAISKYIDNEFFV